MTVIARRSSSPHPALSRTPNATLCGMPAPLDTASQRVQQLIVKLRREACRKQVLDRSREVPSLRHQTSSEPALRLGVNAGLETHAERVEGYRGAPGREVLRDGHEGAHHDSLRKRQLD